MQKMFAFKRIYLKKMKEDDVIVYNNKDSLCQYPLMVQAYWGFADAIIVLYNRKQQQLIVFTNTFNVIDRKKLQFKIKDTFSHVIREIKWMTLDRPILHREYPFEIVRDIFIPIIWQDEPVEDAILAADKLGSPYVRHAESLRHHRFIKMQRLNELAATSCPGT